MNWYKVALDIEEYEAHIRNLVNIIKGNNRDNVKNYIIKLIGEGYRDNRIQGLINKAIDTIRERKNELV